MKTAILTLSLVIANLAQAATYDGIIGFRQAPGSVTISRDLQSVRVYASDSNCVMKFGPIIGSHQVVDGFGHVYFTGYKLAILETCGELASEVILYMQEGRPLISKKYGRVGGYIFR
jgi:hypothetical protein